MIQFLFIFGIFIFAILGMALALHFSKYKQSESGCCGGSHCDANGNKIHSCYHSKVNYIDSKVVNK